jgi:hypothetical protein
MSRLRTAVLSIALLSGLPGTADAGFLNAGFESGDFNGWSRIGDASVVTSAVGVDPRAGLYQALLTTASFNGDLNTFSGSDAVVVLDLTSFLGLPGGSLSPGFEGSAIRQTISVNAGDVLTFDYKFLTTEGGAKDFAFVSLSGVANLADTTAADLVPSGVVLDPVFGDPTRETGWNTYRHVFSTSGTYTLGIGVVDADDEFIPSGLLVDHGSLSPGEVNPVPAPPSFVLVVIGVVTMAVGRMARAVKVA